MKDIDRACCNAKRELKKTFKASYGIYGLHPGIQVELSHLFCKDGIHLSEQPFGRDRHLARSNYGNSWQGMQAACKTPSIGPPLKLCNLGSGILRMATCILGQPGKNHAYLEHARGWVSYHYKPKKNTWVDHCLDLICWPLPFLSSYTCT